MTKTPGYPRKLGRQEVEKIVDEAGGEPNETNPFAPAFFAKAALGLTELQRRESAKLGWWSFGISILAVALAAIAAWFSYMALHEDSSWRTDEIQILKSIESNTANQHQ
jgi:hypothetical protein